MSDAPERPGMHGPMAEFYDTFVDWPGRLGREMPGLTARLEELGARRVLDVGCGTGRHVGALLEAGFDAVGADASDSMLAQARAHVGDDERFVEWRLGDPAPPALADAPPFDAIIGLGNLWPQLLEDADIDATCASFHQLLRPGGGVLLGLKAVAIRIEEKDPYLPLLRREKDGRPLFFVRFLDLSTATDTTVEFHVTVLAGDADDEQREALDHRAGRWRIWSPETLATTFERTGFAAVTVSSALGDPHAPPRSEDVFLHATSPR